MVQVVAGVDLGGTNTLFGLADKSGKVISESRLLTRDYPDINDFVSGMKEMLAAEGVMVTGVWVIVSMINL